MRRAVYLTIILWFMRKVLRKLSRGHGVPVPPGNIRVGRRIVPGGRGYVEGYDDMSWRVLTLDGTDWTHVVAGGVRGDLTQRQWRRLEDEVDRLCREKIREDAGYTVYAGSKPVACAVDSDLVPRWVPSMDDELAALVQGARA